MNNLNWSYVDDGRWEAYSILQDDGNPFVWVISMIDTGLFVINNSSSEILPQNNSFRTGQFKTFEQARFVCEVKEANLKLDIGIFEETKDMFGIQI